MDLLTRDALILITAKASREAYISPDSYLRRYFKEGKEREEAERFLHLMDLIYTGREKLSTWDARWSLDNRSVSVLKWQDDE